MRWAPTNRQLADSLTKDKSEPTDLLRAAMRNCKYQLSDENGILEAAAIERNKRKENGKTTNAKQKQKIAAAIANRKAAESNSHFSAGLLSDGQGTGLRPDGGGDASSVRERGSAGTGAERTTVLGVCSSAQSEPGSV